MFLFEILLTLYWLLTIITKTSFSIIFTICFECQLDKLASAGKTGEPSLSVFEGEEWPRFVKAYANSWLRFHTEWFTSFQGPITVSCFTDLVKDPVSEVSRWLKAMDFDDRRVGCINHDPVGQEMVN